MAITIVSTPSELEHIYNPFYFTVSSDNNSKLNFKYIFDVYCSDAPSNSNNPTDIYCGRYKLSPDYTTGNGIFSPARILESYIANYCNPFSTGITLTNYSQVAIQINFGEEYDSSHSLTGATGTTVYANLTACTGTNAINSARQYNELHSLLDLHNMYDYSINNEFLTNWQSTGITNGNVVINYKKIRTDEYEVLSLVNTNGVFGRFLLYQYDINFSQIQLNNISGGTGAARFDIPTGVPQLSQLISWNTATTYYGIVAYNNNTTAILSKQFYYEIDYDCVRYTTKRICWLNRWGGFDYFSFKLIDRQSTDRKTTEWQRKLPALPQTDWSIGDLSRTVLNIDAKSKFIVTSDWVSDQESAFIQNLFTSPEIYMLDNIAQTKTPIILTDTSVEQGTRLNNTITNYTFNFDYGWYLNLQRS